MGREIRKVPKNWEHPKEADGDFKSLCDDYVGSLKYYKEEVEKFITCMTEVIQKGETKIYDDIYIDADKVYEYFTEDDQLEPPDINTYMPSGDWYQLFQTVSEGTPLSPPFETKEELVEWLVNNKDFWGTQWTRPQAEGIVKCGSAPSMIMTNGKIYTSEQAAELYNDKEN